MTNIIKVVVSLDRIAKSIPVAIYISCAIMHIPLSKPNCIISGLVIYCMISKIIMVHIKSSHLTLVCKRKSASPTK